MPLNCMKIKIQLCSQFLGLVSIAARVLQNARQYEQQNNMKGNSVNNPTQLLVFVATRLYRGSSSLRLVMIAARRVLQNARQYEHNIKGNTVS